LPRSAEQAFPAEALVTGGGSGEALVLAEPLNAWGGLDPANGQIVHERHPQYGIAVTGRVLVLAETRGSGTNAQVFAQAWVNGTGPAAVVLLRPDHVLVAGAIVSAELGAASVPVVVLAPAAFSRLLTGQWLQVRAAGGAATVTVYRTARPAARRAADGSCSSGPAVRNRNAW
jgi:uncharacterized protein